MCKLVLNNQLNGVELYFGEGNKPAKEILTDLKSNGFRWNGKKICWYAKQNNDTLQVANKYSNGTILEVAAVTPVKEVKELNLWDLFQYEEKETDKTYDTKFIAKEIRTHLKNRFKFIKFSVTQPYHGSINVYVLSAPFQQESIYMNYLMEYVNKLVNNYNYCTSYDPYGDYGSSYNFYCHPSIAYDFIQTEATEELKTSMEKFNSIVVEMDKKATEEQERQYQEYLLQREEEKKAAAIRQEEIKKEKEVILNNIEVVEVEEEKQYYIVNANFANLNKNNTLKQYEEEIKVGDYYKNTLKVTREIHFKSIAALKAYSNQLLNDFDFIDGTGGSYTEDKRINSMTDYNNMSEADRKSVEWILHGIAVYFENELQFVIDAQGYSYARYVGLIGADTKTVKEYKYKQVVNDEEIQELKKEAEEVTEIYNNTIKESFDYNSRREFIKELRKNSLIEFNKNVVQQVQEEQIKYNMYEALRINDKLQDQFNDIELFEGEELTIIRESLIGGCSVSHAYYNSAEVGEDKATLTIKIKNKRGMYTTSFTGKDRVLIYKGHINNLDRILYEFSNDENFTSKATKYGSYDSQAFEDIITHLQEKNVLPIINTFKPVF
ncbi:MAG: LPD29 domain-containing protein [Peptostreptococcaceae bacterium]